MKLTKLSTAIWENASEINFGEKEAWDPNTFRKSFFGDTLWTGQNPGWYWFMTDISYKNLAALPPPEPFPKNGCKIGKVSGDNLKLFAQLLCPESKTGLHVIYNGHQQSLMSRIRMHFELNNQRTGAIGLKHYPLSQHAWKVRFFASDHIEQLPDIYQNAVARMIEEKSGRVAIENAWRMEFGWPILCRA